MELAELADVSTEAMYVLVDLSAPILLISLGVGLVVSLLQALTQIQETTLTFVPKIMIIYFSMVMMGSYLFTKLQVFSDHIMQHIMHG